VPKSPDQAIRPIAVRTYAVGREKIREFARAVGETTRAPRPRRRPRRRPPDLVAPPMFAVVYCASAIEQALFDPEVGIDFAMLVHGGQEFEWGPLVIAGDEITTVERRRHLTSASAWRST
jgi:hypothetical protein